jgi:hypothetical protein
MPYGETPVRAKRYCCRVTYLLSWWCTEREATEAVRNGGDWRELVAEDADEPLDLAARLTGEGA